MWISFVGNFGRFWNFGERFLDEESYEFGGLFLVRLEEEGIKALKIQISVLKWWASSLQYVMHKITRICHLPRIKIGTGLEIELFHLYFDLIEQTFDQKTSKEQQSSSAIKFKHETWCAKFHFNSPDSRTKKINCFNSKVIHKNLLPPLSVQFQWQWKPIYLFINHKNYKKAINKQKK